MIRKVLGYNNKNGFTLIEIIVVLVILGILAAIVVPAVMGYINDAREAKYISEARAIYTIFQTEGARIMALDDKTTTYATVFDKVYEETGLQVYDSTRPYPTAEVYYYYDSTTLYDFSYKSDDSKKIHVIINKNKKIEIEIV